MLWLRFGFPASVTRTELTTRTASNPDGVCANNPTGPTIPIASNAASASVPPKRSAALMLLGGPDGVPGPFAAAARLPCS